MRLRTATAFLRRSLTTAAVLWAAATTASAQPGRLGGTTFPMPPDGGTRRFPSVAYDAANNAYLVTWSIHQVGARFVSADGIPLGSPALVVGAGGGGVRAACGAPINTCLIAWVEEPTSIRGRFVRYSGGNVQFLSAPFVINSNGRTKLSSNAPAVVYSQAANEFLIAWTEFAAGGGPDVTARRISPAGALLGGEILVAWTGAWEGFPTATYNTAANQYVVGYYLETGSSSNVAAQRIAPGSGALIGGRSTIYGSTFEQYPEIAYNSVQNSYLLITWGFSGGGWMLHGGLADGNIEPASGILPLAPGGGGDGIGLAYNPVRNTYFAVFQRIENGEVFGVEIGPSGAPGTQFQVTISGTSLSAQPRVAGSTAAPRWQVVASENYRQVMGQLIGSGGSVPSGDPTTPPPPSGGCTTPQPVSNWVCVNGNWLPPDHPDAGGSGGTSTPPPPPPPSSSCTTPQPVSNWVCVNGNWLPPDHPDAIGGGGTTTPPPPPPPSSSCTTPQPAPDWVCVSGNWLPASMACPSAQPAPGWVCVSGNWLPPDHPSVGGGSGGSAPLTSCTSPQPDAGWVCDPATGNWLPPASSSCTTASPGAGWVCYQGNWYPPDHPVVSGGD